VTGVAFEDFGRCRPCVADDFEGGLPSDSFVVLCEVVCRHESKNVGFEVFKVGIVEGLDGRVLDRPVHAFGLAALCPAAWIWRIVGDRRFKGAIEVAEPAVAVALRMNRLIFLPQDHQADPGPLHLPHQRRLVKFRMAPQPRLGSDLPGNNSCS
jgi:hypothetical protein